jgi:hypothetical protein
MMNTMSVSGPMGATDLRRVELSFPADVHMLFLARMTAAAVASRAELDFDQVEDLRLAIDELCIALFGSNVSPGQITLLFQWDTEGTLDIVGTLIPEGEPSSNGSQGAATRSPLSFELSQRILDALVDDHGSDAVGGVHRAWLRVRRREHSA